MSKWGSSEFEGSCGECSNLARSVSGFGGSPVDEKGLTKMFLENLEVIEPMSISSHSSIWKVRNRLNMNPYVLKIIRKYKYGKYWKRISTQLVKYKQLVIICL